MKRYTEARKKSLKEFNEAVQKMIIAVSKEDYDSQLVNMTVAIESLKIAQDATLKLHGGISN